LKHKHFIIILSHQRWEGGKYYLPFLVDQKKCSQFVCCFPVGYGFFFFAFNTSNEVSKIDGKKKDICLQFTDKDLVALLSFTFFFFFFFFFFFYFLFLFKFFFFFFFFFFIFFFFFF